MQLSDREVEAHQALLQYPRDEVPPQLELAVDRITKLDPTTAYLAKWILLPYAEIGKEKALPRSLRLHRSRWEPEIASVIENPVAKAAGITAYVANDSQFLRRPGDGLRVFCVGDNPRHASHRALRKHFNGRKLARNVPSLSKNPVEIPTPPPRTLRFRGEGLPGDT